MRGAAQVNWSVAWPLWIDHLGAEGDWARHGLLDRCVISLLGQIRGKSILDAGCGEGRLSRMLARRGAVVTGVDLVPEFVALAKTIAKNAVSQENLRRWPWLARARHGSTAAARQRYEVGDIADLPRSLDSSFDVVVSCCSLNEVANLHGAASSLAQSLKVGGTCVVVVPHPDVIKPPDVRGATLMGECVRYNEYISSRLRMTNYYRPFPVLINAFADASLLVVRIEEPLAQRRVARGHLKYIRDLRRVRGLPPPSERPWFAAISLRKM